MRIAYILPRYGLGVMGGAEVHGRGVIEQLAQRGHDLEVWTTCVHNIYTWDNEYPPGLDEVNGIPVRRFPVEKHRQYNLFAAPLSRENQYRWVQSLPRSPELCAHIETHADEFDRMIFMPYLQPTTYHGSAICPHKSVIWTCVHDEIWAYLEPTRQMLSNVSGLLMNTPPEYDLITNKLKIQNPNIVVAGMGFDPINGDAAAFRKAYPQVSRNFIVYAGRLDHSKNVDLLVEYFLEYRTRHNRDLSLVLLGGGPLASLKLPGVYSLGFVDEATKYNAIAAASFLCQPSLYESFSIVLMEAWLLNKPVLVHQGCAVTLDHVQRSQGGLYFSSYSDFEGAVNYLLDHLANAQQMGKNGRAYVREVYNWPVVTDKVEGALLEWLGK